MFPMHRIRNLLALAFPLLCFAAPASAVVSVGQPPCAVRTIQAAVNAILASQRTGDFFDNDIVVAGGTYNEAVTIDATGIAAPSGAIISITGGYDAGCNGPQVGSATFIDASNRAASVLTMKNGKLTVRLDTLALTNASVSGNGGGIDFDGAGSLDMTNVDVKNNHAGRGGGLYANGHAPGLLITLHDEVSIFGNEAARTGGGIRVQGQTHLVMLGNDAIFNNTVNINDGDGAGGGIQIVGPADAQLHSVDIFGNVARQGGAISVNDSGGSSASVVIDTAPGGDVSRLEFNRASASGGGLYVSGHASARCIECEIRFNAGIDGAAATVDSGNGVLVIDRGEIVNNLSQNFDGALMDGAIIDVGTDSGFSLFGNIVSANRGGHLYRGNRTANGQALFSTLLIVQNRVSDDLFRLDGDGAMSFRNSTVADNLIGGSAVFSVSGFLTLVDSIVWQIGKITLEGNDINERNIGFVLASETGSLDGFHPVISVDPQFVAPGNSDYHLQPTSPALDFAPPQSGTDLDGLPRSVDLHIHNSDGPVDLGAFELQSLPIGDCIFRTNFEGGDSCL